MDAEQYDQWYETSRGSWIGEREYELLFGALEPRPGESLLDIGCGTGFFTRKMAGVVSGKIVGVDINQKWIEYARRKNSARISYAAADARRLPFADNAFDLVMSVAALCFVNDMDAAVKEMIRTARRRFAVGLLNRRSLLWMKKGRGGGRGAYRGARWHTKNEAMALFSRPGVKNVMVETAVHFPGGGVFARFMEPFFPSWFPTGAFILVKGDAGSC